ncbi:MAG: hypothetical protein ACOC78_01430 [Actinomycetota bacterium]
MKRNAAIVLILCAFVLVSLAGQASAKEDELPSEDQQPVEEEESEQAPTAEEPLTPGDQQPLSPEETEQPAMSVYFYLDGELAAVQREVAGCCPSWRSSWRTIRWCWPTTARRARASSRRHATSGR